MLGEKTDSMLTICVSYYNDEKYLKTCIDSILSQTYDNFELILLNHASTDNSRNIAHSYNDSRIIHIDTPKNLGAGASYNFRYILPLIKGKYYKPFCADDVMAPNCVELLLDYSYNNPEKDVIFGNMEYINSSGEKIKKDFFGEYRTLEYASELDIMKYYSESINRLPCPASLIKVDILKNIDMDQSLTIWADMWLWLSALTNGAKFGFCNKTVAFYRRHEFQESFLDRTILEQREKYEQIPLLSLFFNLKDTQLVKEIFSDSPYKDLLTDSADIIFYIAEYYLRKYGYIFAYEKLFYMLKDADMAKHLEETFNFGVLELRKLYAFKVKEQSYKKRVYAKKPKYLSMTDIIFLLLNKIANMIINVITLRFLRKK